MLWWGWLGRLKWHATGLDASVLFCSASRRCSRKRSASNRNDLLIKAADKGGATVVWRTDLYQQEAICRLSDPIFYTKVNKDLTTANQKIQELITKQELPVTA